MRKTFFLLLVCFFGTTLFSGAVDKSTQDLIDKADSQQLLTQKIVKDFLLTGALPDMADYRRDLDNAVAKLEETHLELEDIVAKNKALTRSLTAVRKLWEPFRIIAVSEPSHKNAIVLLKRNTAFMNACATFVAKIESAAKLKKNPTNKAANNLAIYSQRLAMDYVAYYWKVPHSKITLGYRGTFKKMAGFYKSLQKNKPVADVQYNLDLIRSEMENIPPDLTKVEFWALSPIEIRGQTNYITDRCLNIIQTLRQTQK